MRRALQLLVVTAAACSGGTTGPGGTVTGTFTAVIDGQAWSGSSSQFATSGGSVPGTQSMGGSKVVSASDYTTVTLIIGYISGPGTYPLGVNQGTTAGGTAMVAVQSGSGTLGVWTTAYTGASGSVTITNITGTRITGTFQFSATPQLGTSATGTKVVTNGVFDMPLGSGFAAAPASNRGSKVGATLGGASWNAATVVALGTSTGFGISSSSDAYSLTLTPATVLSAGNSYPIGPGGLQLSVIRTGTSNNWTSGTGASVGTFTLTTFAAGRATGIFNATLLPGVGTTGSLVITNGTFDVRVDAP